MKVKKVIAVAVVIALTGGAAAGGINSYKSYQEKNLVIEVQPVSSLNWGYYGDTQTSYGMVTNDSAQEIYLEDANTVAEVFVSEGDTVSEGDRLLQYDMSEVQIEIKRKRLEVSTTQNNKAIAEHALETLRKIKPVERPDNDTTYMSERRRELERKIKELESYPEKDKKDSRIYNYVTDESEPYNADTADGSEENPYIFYCNKDAYAYGSFFNSIRASSNGGDGIYVKFIICKKDSNGKMVMGEETELPPDTPDTEEPDDTGTDTECENPAPPFTPVPIPTPPPETEEPLPPLPTENPLPPSSETQAPENPFPPDNPQPPLPTENPLPPSETQAPENPPASTEQLPDVTQGTDAALGDKQQESGGEEALKEKSVTVSDTVRYSGPVKKVPVPDDSVTPNTIVFNGNNFPTAYDEERMWYIFSGEEVYNTLQDLLDEIEEEEDSLDELDGYTKEDLAEAIADKQEEIRKLDLELRKERLQLQSLEDTASDGIVYAKLDGVVKSVGDPDDGESDGAFLVLTGEDGLYVKGTISELLLDTVKPGTVVTANSWESGNTFQATVTEISDYPVSGNSWGEGNPNVSYYEYTAFIEDSSALKNGEYVDLSIAANQTETDTNAIYIEKAYVREEDGKSYCMIADENDRLKKQYVVTGKTIYGSAVEIKSGLSESDRIAFPYGKNAVEGANVIEESRASF